MSQSANLYGNVVAQALEGNVNVVGHPLKMGLLGGGYTPDLLHHVHWSDVSGQEITGAGYTAGGATLSSVSLAVTGGAAWTQAWAAANSYAYGRIIRPAPANGFLYRAVQAGTTGGTQPSFPAVEGETVVDSGVVWSCLGTTLTVLTSAAVTWTTATFTAYFAVLYDSTTGVLIALQSFGAAQQPSAINYTITPDPALGWAVLSPPG